MNRPAVHNAFDDQQIERLTNALNEAAGNEAVKVVVLGSTGKTFCAGGDLNYMRRMGTLTYEENLADAARLAELLRTLNFLARPTIARVQGAAFGGGVGLLSCCDVAIGTPYTKMALSEVKLGIAPATIAPYVVRAIGERNARRLFLTGELVRAERAQEIGYISEIAEDIDAAIEKLASAILLNGPNAVRGAKQAIFNVTDAKVEAEMIQKTVKMIADMRDSKEGREGMSAFLEKRPPGWAG
jgi:methylglutaconyl-CoA hydratase